MCTYRINYSVPIKGFLDYQDAEKLISKLRKRIEYDQDGKPIR